ncbi:MAG: hypothetical protein AAGG68_30825 [Bacteroidota bacterium]
MSKIVKAIGEINRDLDKSAIEELAKEDAFQIIRDDRYDLMKVYVEFKRYETYLKVLMQEIKEETCYRAAEQGIENFEFGKAKLIISNRRTYDYSNDVIWNHISSDMKHLKQVKKEREQLLKKIKGDYQDIVNEETGEVERLLAPEVSYTQSLMVRL